MPPSSAAAAAVTISPGIDPIVSALAPRAARPTRRRVGSAAASNGPASSLTCLGHIRMRLKPEPSGRNRPAEAACVEG
jgi:hypothetical protein